MELTKKLAEARAKRAALVEQAGQLLTAAEGEKRALSDEERTSWQAYHDEAKRAAEEIAMLETQIEAERSAVSSIIVRDNPAVTQRARYRGQLRGYRTEESAYRMGMYARAILFDDERAAQWCKENEIRVMTGTSAAKGGVLVPEEMSQAIIDLREVYGVARQELRVVPMGSDTMVMPRRAGGLTAYFANETTATTESDKAWDSVQLTARNLSCLARFSRDLAEDAVIDIGMDLADEMAYAFAAKEDDCLFNGNGASTYGGILGLRPAIINGLHTAGAKDAAAGHDTYAEIDADDILTMMAALPKFAEPNAKHYCSRQGKVLVFDALVAAAGGNNIQTLGGKPQQSYLGYPIVDTQAMPTSTGDLSDLAMFLFGDLNKAVTMGDRRGFRFQVLQERYAEYRQIGVIGDERFDIVVHDLGDTTTGGPIVALIGE